mgnify:CR=1 FL=1
MDSQVILRIAVHFVCFIAALAALSGVDFSKFMRSGKAFQMQLLYVLLSIALGYGVAQFFMSISIY